MVLVFTCLYFGFMRVKTKLRVNTQTNEVYTSGMPPRVWARALYVCDTYATAEAASVYIIL